MTKPTGALVLLSAVALTACGGVGGNVDTTGPAPLTRLSGCTPVNTSRDPAASVCLAGTYAGKTVDDKACSLTVRADGSYDYAGPTLNYTYTPNARTIRVFDYRSLGGFNQLAWSIGDPAQAAMYDLSVTARWGTGTGHPPVDIKATKDVTTSSTCSVPLP